MRSRTHSTEHQFERKNEVAPTVDAQWSPITHTAVVRDDLAVQPNHRPDVFRPRSGIRKHYGQSLVTAIVPQPPFHLLFCKCEDGQCGLICCRRPHRYVRTEGHLDRAGLGNEL